MYEVQQIENEVYNQMAYLRLSVVLVFDPVVKRVGVELQCPLQASFALNLHDSVAVLYHLNETNTVPDGQAAIRQHSVINRHLNVCYMCY